MKTIVFTSNVSWAMVKFRYKLLEHLISEGYTLYIIAPKDDFVPKLESLGCHCIDIHLSRKGVNPIEDFLLFYKLYTLYKEIQPDIIFHYSIKPIVYGSFAAKLLDLRSVAVNIGLGYTFIHTNIVTKISHLLYKWSLPCATMVWFINEEDREEFVSRGFVTSSKTLVLPSEGVDLEYFTPLEIKKEEATSFLLIARMLKDKGIIEFYEAAKKLKKSYPQVKFQLLGNVDLENPRGIEQEILEQWHQEGVIEYLGYAKDVRSYIAQASCVVLPSYREGKGMTLIEAAAMKKPLIATDVEGCRDIVKDGYNGFLCEVRNSESLAEVMEKFLTLSMEEQEQMGENGYRFVKENFDIKRVITIYMQTLKRFSI